MPMQETMLLAMVGKEDMPHNHRNGCRPTFEPTTAPVSETDSVDCHFSFTEDKEMMEGGMCYLNLLPDSAIDNPLDMDAIKEQQDADNNCKIRQ